MADSTGSDLSGVIAGDWCVGCGACTGVDASVELVLDRHRGSYRPSHASGAAAAAVCPAVEVDISALSRTRYPDGPETVHGVVLRTWLAQATDAEGNLAASSGGLIKPVLRHLLERGVVEGVVALAEVEGLDYRQRLHRTSAEIDALPGSIYHVVQHADLYRILATTDGPLAVVGIPCQLEGLRLFLASPEGRRHADRVVMTVGVFCGWQFTTHAIDALGRFLRFDPTAITSVAYRGGGPVGKTRIGLSDGSQRTLNRRVDYAAQVAFDRSFNLPRCHVCVNHSNFLADLAVGDAWLPETAFSRTGVSIAIARSALAEQVVSALESAGRIRLMDVDPSVIERSQGRVVAYGDQAYALMGALERVGEHVPRIDAPNRTAHVPVDAAEVLAMWRQVRRKRELQQQGRYRLLWFRKATVELPSLLRRLARSRLIARYARAVFGRRRPESSASTGTLVDFR